MKKRKVTTRKDKMREKKVKERERENRDGMKLVQSDGKDELVINQKRKKR